jgi:hypothetical protein
MADAMRVQGPIEVQSDADSRVAFDLMQKISNFDKVPAEQKDEKYWLGLYRKCWRVAKGYDPNG